MFEDIHGNSCDFPLKAVWRLVFHIKKCWILTHKKTGLRQLMSHAACSGLLGLDDTGRVGRRCAN